MTGIIKIRIKTVNQFRFQFVILSKVFRPQTEIPEAALTKNMSSVLLVKLPNL